MLLKYKISATDGLTAVEKEIGNYIISNRELTLESTIIELSKNAAVSKSSIHRFCKKIGFKGFNGLKTHLADELARPKDNETEIDVNYPFNIDDNAQAIAEKLLKLYDATLRDTYNYVDAVKLKQISAMLRNADVIDIYTNAHNMNAAENFQDKMLMIGRYVNCPKTFYKQRLSATASNSKRAALILSYSGKATFIETIVKLLSQRRTPIILIGREDCNLYPQYIKHTVYLSGKEDLRNRISQFSSHIALQYMLDVIYSCIYNMDRDKNAQYLKNNVKIVDDRVIEK